MRDYGLGDAPTINAFVKEKLNALEKADISFFSLFELMFREKENILYEKSAGYRIEKTSYGQAYDNILCITSAIKSELSNLEIGATVGLYMDNCLGWIEAFWAILAAGYCPLLINRKLPKPALLDALKQTNTKVVISDGEIFDCKTIIFDTLFSTQKADLKEPFGETILVMSSGTSDSLKICEYSANEIYYMVLESYDIIRKCPQVKKHYNQHLKLLAFLPFYHIFGLIAVYIWFAFFSRTFVHLQDMSPDTITNTIKRHQVTHIFAVPLFWETVYDRIQKTLKLKDQKTQDKVKKGLKISKVVSDLPIIGQLFIKKAFSPLREQIFGESICFMITGGGSIKKEVLTFFNSIGYMLVNGYGMTEIGITSVELSSKNKIINQGYVGKPLSYIEYKINPDGELLVRGKSTAKHIYVDGKDVVMDDWYNTKDLASCVKGRYLILGRHDDVIVAANGENLNPELLEPYFRCEGVNGVALIKEKTAEGERPVLLVSINRTVSAARFETIDKHIKQAANNSGLATLIGKAVYTCDPLIKEGEFKCNRLRIAKDYTSGNMNIVSPEKIEAGETQDTDEITLRVRELFATALGKESMDIRYDADFFLDEGGTSLDYFSMVSVLQSEFSIPFPTDGSKSYNTVSQIVSFIKDGKHNVD